MLYWICIYIYYVLEQLVVVPLIRVEKAVYSMRGHNVSMAWMYGPRMYIRAAPKHTLFICTCMEYIHAWIMIHS